jgi:hypothetical protein
MAFQRSGSLTEAVQGLVAKLLQVEVRGEIAEVRIDGKVVALINGAALQVEACTDQSFVAGMEVSLVRQQNDGKTTQGYTLLGSIDDDEVR